VNTPAPIQLDVAIAGGGFGGVYTAKALAKALPRDRRIRCGIIAEDNFMVFQPLLAEVAGAAISARHVVNPIRLLCRGVEVIRGRISKIDLERRQLAIHAGEFTRTVTVEFNHLVLALGSVVDLSRVPGMAEHAYLLKNAGDALQLRGVVIDRMEEANLVRDQEAARRLLTFVIVGGGYSGVETAGQILDLLHRVHRFYSHVDEKCFRVILIHSGPHLLPEMHKSLGCYCQDRLEARGLEVLLNERVTAMTASKVYLRNGRSIESYTVVSTVGNAPNPVILEMCDAHRIATEKGRVVTDGCLRVQGRDRLWALGDCAAVPHHQGGRCPATAQFAMRQGALAGKNIAAAIAGKDLEPFRFKGVGTLASIGHRRAVADVFGMKFSGFIAWFLWRTLYLLKLPGLDRKIRVVSDWTLELFFARDISLLRPAPTQVHKGMHLQEGDRLFQAGEPAYSFYIVKSGRVDLSENGRLIKTLRGGDHFGERALLEDGIWKFDAVAAESSELIAVERDLFRTLSHTSESIHQLMEHSALQYLPAGRLADLVRQVAPHVQERSAAELMQRRVVTMNPAMKLEEALRLICHTAYNSFPFLDSEGCPLGLVHQDELLDQLKRGALRLGARLEGFPVAPAPTASPESRVPELIEIMVRNGSRKLLIVDERRRLLGMLSFFDLLSGPEECSKETEPEMELAAADARRNSP
jgi:NADH:ubiquinone reductase (H+-translocating)